MNRSLVILLLICFGGLYYLPAKAQTLIHPKFAPLGYHHFDSPNKPFLYENRIDANGNWVVEPNVMLSIETYLRGTKLSWRFMPGFYSDALSQPAMFFHIGLKYNFLQIWRSSFDIAIGPTLNFRENWNRVPGYTPEGDFNLNGSWENQFNILAELEYKFFLSDRFDITASAIYGHSWKTVTFSAGFRYWLSTIIKHPIDCGSCPFDKTSHKPQRR
jgi:hypothetical protein